MLLEYFTFNITINNNNNNNNNKTSITNVKFRGVVQLKAL